jgi:hypothetical protein
VLPNQCHLRGERWKWHFLAIKTQVSQGFETRLPKERLTPPGSGGGHQPQDVGDQVP